MNIVITVVVLLVVGGFVWNRMRNTSSSSGFGGFGGFDGFGGGSGSNEEENGEE